MSIPFLTPLLRPRPRLIAEAIDAGRIREALEADPALAGRAAYEDGMVILTSPATGPSPTSAKERRRWELHVRLRIAVEFGDGPETLVPIRWTLGPTPPAAS